MLSSSVTCFIFLISLWTWRSDGHVRLTFPPARQYALDFLDNARTGEPCGAPPYPGAPRTTLVEGTSMRATWHLSYAHRGGVELEIIEENPTRILASLTRGQYLFLNDSTRQYADVILPINLTCINCTLRLLRQASEWGSNYRFWSCADVTIVSHPIAASTQCSNITFVSAKSIALSGEPEPEATAEPEPEATGEPKPKYTAKPEPFPTAELEASEVTESQPNSEPEQDVTSEPEPEGSAESEPEGSAEPEPESNAEAEPEGSAEPEPKSNAEPEPEATSEPEPEATSEPEPEANAEPEPEATSEPEPKSNVEPKSNAEPAPEGAAADNHTSGNACFPVSALQFDSCYDGKCLNGGTCNSGTGTCSCLRLFSGARCEVFDRCWSDSDCNNGQCIDTRSTTHPRLLCYCQQGWFSDDCSKKSTVVVQSNYQTNPSYHSRVVSPVMTVFWKIEGQEIEVALQAKTLSWVGLGWRPRSLTDNCKAFPTVASASQVDTEYVKFVDSQKGRDTSGPSSSLDPEKAIEDALESNIETLCKGTKTVNTAHQNPAPEPLGRVVQEPGKQPEPPLVIVDVVYYTRPEPDYQEVQSEPEPEPNSHNGSDTSHSDQPLTHPMDCTDIVIGSVKGALHRVQDMYTKDRSTPRPDFAYNGDDDLTGSAGSQVNGVTTIVFRKKLQATHHSDHTIDNQLMSVIWAMGQGVDQYIHNPNSGLEACTAPDARFYRHDELKYHGFGNNQRGTASINFFATNTSSDAPCSDEKNKFQEPINCDATEGGFNCDYYMSYSYNQADDTIEFVLKSKQAQNRWIGLGVSSDQAMTNTDVITAWIDGEGNPVVKDRWATGYSLPPIDPTNNLESVTGSYLNGVMTIKFKRARDTNDNDKDLPFTDDTCQYLIYASGPLNGGGSDITKHSSTPIVSPAKVCIKSCSSKTSTAHFSATLNLINEVFTDDLNDETSVAYENLKEELETLLRDALKKETEHSVAVEVTGFSPGSVIVSYTVTYVFNSASEDEGVVEAALKESLLKEVSDNGGALGTYSASVSFEKGAPKDWVIAVISAAVMAAVLVTIAVVSQLYRARRARVPGADVVVKEPDRVVDAEANIEQSQKMTSRTSSVGKKESVPKEISPEVVEVNMEPEVFEEAKVSETTEVLEGS